MREIDPEDDDFDFPGSSTVGCEVQTELTDMEAAHDTGIAERAAHSGRQLALRRGSTVRHQIVCAKILNSAGSTVPVAADADAPSNDTTTGAGGVDA